MKDLFEKFKEYVKNTYNMDVVRSDDGIPINDIFSDGEEKESEKDEMVNYSNTEGDGYILNPKM